MRILFFIGEMTEGGAERVISILTDSLAERGFDVEIMMYYDSPVFYDIDNRVRITSLVRETGKQSRLSNLLWFRRYCRDHADIVVSFLAPFNIYALTANLFNHLPVIVADRNDPRYIPGNPFMRTVRNLLYRSAQGVVLQTRNNQDYFSKAVQKKSIVIGNPVSMKDKAGMALKTAKEKQIVSAGRLMPQKNQKMLIEAFGDIRNEYPDYRLVIYGEGPYRKELEDLISDLKLNGSVSLPGNTRNLFEQISRAELFVLSSDYEGMSNALLEAMCLGLPCISTKVSGTEELIDDHKNGILVDIGNRQQLISSIRELLQEEDKRREMGKEAAKKTEEYDKESIVKKWIDFINKVMDGYNR